MPHCSAASRNASRISQLHPRRLDPPLAAGAVELVGAPPVVLRALEVGQHVVPGPAGIAELAPVVVVGRLAAHVDHAVDRRAAAQHLAARIVQRTSVQAGLGLGLEAPVGARVAHGVEIADRDVDPEVVVAAAGLQQQDAVRWGRRTGGWPARSRPCRRRRRCSRTPPPPAPSRRPAGIPPPGSLYGLERFQSRRRSGGLSGQRDIGWRELARLVGPHLWPRDSLELRVARGAGARAC